jgi:hypothetical protein
MTKMTLRLPSIVLACALVALPAASQQIRVSFDPALRAEPLDGRLLLLLSTDSSREPRFQINWDMTRTMQVFGIDVENFEPGQQTLFDADTFGFPVPRLGDIEPGDYWVQAVLHRYETFERAAGPAVKLPASWAAGQQWSREPGNLYSTPVKLRVDGSFGRRHDVVLDSVMPNIEPPSDSQYVKHVKMRSELLSEFWGRDMFLGAHVLLPEGFDEHPQARYPLAVFHGHFPVDFGGFSTEPPDTSVACVPSARFGEPCYNRLREQEAYDFYRRWTSDDFPRFLIVEIQHANPFYDDSYAVNSDNLGPYGDAITYELIPFLEEKFRGLGEGWARFLYGGSTGGWEALAAQIFYPDEYNGAFGACPDPIDFRAYMTVDLYGDANAYYREGPFGRIARPGLRDRLGHVTMTIEDFNHLELTLGTKTRSGQQFDIWEAVYSPRGDDGYPKRLFDKRTGEIDAEVAAHWREHYDLGHILERDWSTLGPKLEGKLHIYAGDMDNYYLNNAVYLVEDLLESTTDPPYGGVIDYGDRAEHCWNGDQENPNHISRLRYNTFYVPKILERIEASAPEGADLTSWRY